MSIPVIAFFNNKGGVGKTSLVYHIAWMLADMGVKVLAADLDPQANLTAAFLDEEAIEIWWDMTGDDAGTVFSGPAFLLRDTGAMGTPITRAVDSNLSLFVGDPLLSIIDDEFKAEPERCSAALRRVLQLAAESSHSQLVLADLGSNLGVLNRAAMAASEYIVIPVSPDLLTIRALQALGPTLRRWQRERGDANQLAAGATPLGYVIIYDARLGYGGGAYQSRIAETYAEYVLASATTRSHDLRAESDPSCLGILKPYPTLAGMAREARKPVFHLKPADGAIGAQMQAVNDSYRAFKKLATTILDRAGVPVPSW